MLDIPRHSPLHHQRPARSSAFGLEAAESAGKSWKTPGKRSTIEGLKLLRMGLAELRKSVSVSKNVQVFAATDS
jgi:hypothetical protein